MTSLNALQAASAYYAQNPRIEELQLGTNPSQAGTGNLWATQGTASINNPFAQGTYTPGTGRANYEQYDVKGPVNHDGGGFYTKDGIVGSKFDLMM